MFHTDREPADFWRWAPGLEGKYSVSRDGRVRTHVRGAIREVGYLNANGYRMFYVKGAGKPRFVHRSVLEAFVGAAPSGLLGVHLDGVKTNNHLPNLKWATQTENMSHRVEHGTANRGERHGIAKLTADQVIAIRRDYRPRRPGSNYFALAARFGVTYQTVHSIVRRKTWTHI